MAEFIERKPDLTECLDESESNLDEDTKKKLEKMVSHLGCISVLFTKVRSAKIRNNLGCKVDADEVPKLSLNFAIKFACFEVIS